MLIAEINPSMNVAKQSDNLFGELEIINCNYMSAIARPYRLGADKVNFQLVFGILESDQFKEFKNSQVEMTKEELETWGENDEVCLNLIANKIGTSVLSTKEVEVRF